MFKYQIIEVKQNKQWDVLVYLRDEKKPFERITIKSLKKLKEFKIKNNIN
jgi:hypothetical protein